MNTPPCVRRAAVDATAVMEAKIDRFNTVWVVTEPSGFRRFFLSKLPAAMTWQPVVRTREISEATAKRLLKENE